MRRSLADWLAGVRGADPSTLATTCLAVLILGAIAVRAPWLLPDSQSYVQNSPVRTPVYPLLLDLLGALFGEGFGRPAALVQSAFVALCAVRFAGALRTHYGFGRPGACGVAAILLIPLVRFGPMIVPESLGYGFLIWFSALLFEGAATRSPRAVVAASALCALAILTRTQYAVLVPALGLHLAGQLLFAGGPARRPMALALALSVALLLGQSLAQRTYHYLVNDTFTEVSLGGLSMMTVQLYLSNPAELDYFEEGAPRRLLAAAYPIFEQKALLRRHKPEGMPDTGHYQFVFDEILYGVVLPAYQAERSIARRADMTVEDWAELDSIATTITRELALRHPVRFATHAARELYQTERYFLLLVALLPAIGAALWIRSRDPWWAAVGLVGVVACANYALVALVHSVLIRYTYAPDSLVLAAVVASLVRAGAAPRAS